MLRCIGLHNNLPGQLMASGSAGNLRQQLEGFFRRPEVRQVQRGIGSNHSHQRNVRKIQPFGYHLRAQQHIGFFVPELVQQLLV
ncbi:hypothetical protein D3C87_1797190 [compost metagenome]